MRTAVSTSSVEGMRGLDVPRQAEEHVAHLARRVLLTPDAAAAEVGDGADAVVDRDALAVACLVDTPLAGRLADLDIAERQVIAIQQLRHLRSGGQRFAFGAAVGDGLGAQPLDARPEFVELRRRSGLDAHQLLRRAAQDGDAVVVAQARRR